MANVALIYALLQRNYTASYYREMLPEIEKLSRKQVLAMCSEYWNGSTAEARKDIVEHWANYLECIDYYERGTVDITSENMDAICKSEYRDLGKHGTNAGLSGKELKEATEWWLSIGDYVLSIGHMQYVCEKNGDMNDWRNR